MENNPNISNSSFGKTENNPEGHQESELAYPNVVQDQPLDTEDVVEECPDPEDDANDEEEDLLHGECPYTEDEEEEDDDEEGLDTEEGSNDVFEEEPVAGASTPDEEEGAVGGDIGSGKESDEEAAAGEKGMGDSAGNSGKKTSSSGKFYNSLVERLKNTTIDLDCFQKKFIAHPLLVERTTQDDEQVRLLSDYLEHYYPSMNPANVGQSRHPTMNRLRPIDACVVSKTIPPGGEICFYHDHGFTEMPVSKGEVSFVFPADNLSYAIEDYTGDIHVFNEDGDYFDEPEIEDYTD